MARLKEIQQSDILSHWLSVDYLPRWGVLLLDLLIVFIAYVISFIIGSNLLEYNVDYLLFPVWLHPSGYPCDRICTGAAG